MRQHERCAAWPWAKIMDLRGIQRAAVMYTLISDRKGQRGRDQVTFEQGLSPVRMGWAVLLG